MPPPPGMSNSGQIGEVWVSWSVRPEGDQGRWWGFVSHCGVMGLECKLFN